MTIADSISGALDWSPWWVLLGLIILVGSVCLAGLGGRGETDTQDEALAVLRRRYATGDIDDAEFEERRARLSGTRHS